MGTRPSKHQPAAEGPVLPASKAALIELALKERHSYREFWYLTSPSTAASVTHIHHYTENQDTGSLG